MFTHSVVEWMMVEVDYIGIGHDGCWDEMKDGMR
jgi:hypothetical protein